MKPYLWLPLLILPACAGASPHDTSDTPSTRPTPAAPVAASLQPNTTIDSETAAPTPPDTLTETTDTAASSTPPLVLPICGTFTSAGYAEYTLLVPETLNSPAVTRYAVNDGGVFPPIETNDGWWICVTEGNILAEPNMDEPDPYGKILITAISSHQTNGEKDME